MSELPAGWVVCQLSDIGHIVTGKTPSTKEPRFYGGEIPFIKPGDLDHSGAVISTEVYLTDDGLTEVPALPPDSIVVTCIGNLGKVGITTKLSASNQQINAVVPDQGVDPTYIFHYCKTLKPWLESESSATTISIVNKGVFSTAPVALPPLTEQTRIAQKLDELLAQVDSLKARIDAIPALLKRFRQSVLAAAVSGRLTEEWRGKNTGELGPVLNPKAKALGMEELAAAEELLTEPLPTFWKKYALEQLVEPDRGIPYGIVQTGSAVDKGIPTVRCGDVKSLFIDTSSLKIVSAEIEHEYKRTRLKGGEVLLAIRGSVGNVGVAPAALRDCNISREVAMIPTLPSVLPFYLACLLQSPLGQRLLVGKVRGVAQKGINLSDVRRLPVALPPYEEQTEVVCRVEQLFAFADQLEAKVTSAKSRIDHLTQSILAKAFRGELVPQDPNDAPASVLLERIKAQRAVAPKPKRARKDA